MTFEQRMAFVMEVSEVVNTARARRLREELLDQLRSQLLLKQGSKKHLVFLLKRVAALEKDQGRLGALFEAAKTYLLGVADDSDLDDFEALGKFVEAFSGLVRSEELQQAREHFSNFCNDYDDSWADSPDDLRYIADSVSSVGSMLTVDVDACCSSLESRASQWEEDLPVSEEDKGDDDDEERWGHSELMSDDTSAMFEGLLDELNETEP